MSHAPRTMTRVGRFPRKKAGLRHGRWRNVWYVAFTCPKCGDRVVRLANPLARRLLICRGVPRKEIAHVQL